MTDYKPSAPPTGPEEGSSDPLNPLNPLNPPPPQISPPPYPGLDGHSPPPPLLGFTIHPNPSAYSTPPPSYQPVPLYPQTPPHLYPHPHPYQPTTTITPITQFVVHAGRQPGTVTELPKLFALKKYFLVGALLFSLVFTFFELSTAREVVRLRFAYSDKKDVVNILLQICFKKGNSKNGFCFRSTPPCSTRRCSPPAASTIWSCWRPSSATSSVWSPPLSAFKFSLLLRWCTATLSGMEDLVCRTRFFQL